MTRIWLGGNAPDRVPPPGDLVRDAIRGATQGVGA